MSHPESIISHLVHALAGGQGLNDRDCDICIEGVHIAAKWESGATEAEGEPAEKEVFPVSTKETKLLHLAYSALIAIFRTGAPLDDSWPSSADEAIEQIGEYLWPVTVPVESVGTVEEPARRSDQSGRALGTDRDGHSPDELAAVPTSVLLTPELRERLDVEIHNGISEYDERYDRFNYAKGVPYILERVWAALTEGAEE